MRAVAIHGPAAFARIIPESSPLNIEWLRAPIPDTCLRLGEGANSGRRSPLGTLACQDGSIGGVPKHHNRWASAGVGSQPEGTER